eukprot:UN10781
MKPPEKPEQPKKPLKRDSWMTMQPTVFEPLSGIKNQNLKVHDNSEESSSGSSDEDEAGLHKQKPEISKKELNTFWKGNDDNDR